MELADEMYASFYARGMRRMMKQYQNAAGGENKCKGKIHYKYSDEERERERERGCQNQS